MKTLNYRVTYFFKHSIHGFSNNITVTAISVQEAADKVVNAVSECYGSKMLKRFSFQQPVAL